MVLNDNDNSGYPGECTYDNYVLSEHEKYLLAFVRLEKGVSWADEVEREEEYVQNVKNNMIQKTYIDINDDDTGSK